MFTDCPDCENRTLNEDGYCFVCQEEADRVRFELGSECRHGLPVHTCAICLGRWDHDLRSKVTGKVRSSREFIPWFVPSTLGHDREPLRPVEVESRRLGSGNGCPSSSLGAAPVLHSETPTADLEVVGPPVWYRREYRFQLSTFDKVISAAGADWYGMLETHLADLIAAAAPAGVIEPIPEPVYGPAAPQYRAGSVRAWRRATGRALI
jgi:hypothetical protein